MIFFYPNQRCDIITALYKCVYWFKQVSQVSDVAHPPLGKAGFFDKL